MSVEADLDVPAIAMVDPMPGFPGARRFALVELTPGGALSALRSLDDPELRFLVVPPVLFFPDYAPEIDDETAHRLQLATADDALLLLVVTPGRTPEEATVNLLAPIVVNHRARLAAQVVLADASLPLRAPLRRPA